MSPGELVASFQCYNVNLSKMASRLHRFFDPATAQMQVKDLAGNFSTPKEWFSVPLGTIETAVRLLISGEILHYVYDAESGAVKLVE